MATMTQIRRITWSIFWKAAVLGIAGGIIAGWIIGWLIGFYGTIFGFQAEELYPLSIWAGYLGWTVASFFALNWALAYTIGKNIGGLTLEVARPTTREAL